ncbi:flagellar assembly protein A [Desulfobacter vibrioformis]|uniref:flagellar assembly protein A n=1 Tax=Desulfobacter vibrioformis TaxID=34031 RepID=UPI0005558D76|nr:flagellar assembly protein A [Desulfobacter vibrioformis]
MASRSKQDKAVPLIGILAVKHHFISEEQLQKALAQCSDDSNLGAALKKYFLSDNLISPQNVHRLDMAAKVVTIHQKEHRFGAIALARGLVNKSVLDLALEEQKEQLKQGKKPRRIGDVMVEAGLITLKQRDEILKLQNRSCKPPGQANKPLSKTDPAKYASVAVHGENQADPGHDALNPSADNTPEPTPESNDCLLLDRMEQATQICGSLLLQVTCDHLSAFLSKTCDMDPDIPAVVIRTALAEKGVVFGLAPDYQIEEFIRSPIADSTFFNVAQGVEPSPGRNTKIEFFFNTDYLKTGGMDDSGNIDFKYRGPGPLVEPGTVLAEKIAGTRPRPGKDVYGNTIQALGGTDNPFRVGTGAVLSEDGRKVLATVRGCPRITLAGFIVVHEESDIDGNIDNNTGPVEFDGNIRVTGSIKSGVCGVDITAQAVDNGIVEANGDLTIVRGIHDARVYARGNVYAQSITHSEIVCMGDVFVQKKIMDSSIECSGSCSIITGKLVSSQVTAKMGLMARSIASGTAGPSRIRVGHDVFAARELERNSAGMARLEKEIQDLGRKKNTIRRQAIDLKKQMTDLARVREQLQVQCREIESQPELPLGDRDALDRRLDELRKSLKATETKRQMCATKTRDLVRQAAKMDRQSLKSAASKKALADEKKNLISWSEHTPGKARVAVDGKIMPGTVIMGLHSRFVPVIELCHVRITERPVKSDEGENSEIIYQMQVDNF